MRMPHGVVAYVSYGKEKIEYNFYRLDRKTLEIAVYPNCAVLVKAPLGIAPAEVQERVARRARWIIRQRNFFLQFDPRTPARCYVGGETHLYLGRRYRLKIGNGRHDDIKLVKGYFEIKVKGRVISRKIKYLLDEWYTRKAMGKFRERLEHCLHYFKRPALQQPRLQIKQLKRRWGSLSGKGVLILNIDLIRSPIECIDYVIVHELCHVQYRDHGPEFYKLLGKTMPDWKDRKHKLELTLA